MKLAIATAMIALLAAGCATSSGARHARWDAQRLRLCPEKSRVYDNGVFASCRESGQLTALAKADQGRSSYYYGGNTAENVRNTPYQNAIIDQSLARIGANKH